MAKEQGKGKEPKPAASAAQETAPGRTETEPGAGETAAEAGGAETGTEPVQPADSTGEGGGAETADTERTRDDGRGAAVTAPPPADEKPDAPLFEDWVKAGKDPEAYPPKGFNAVESPAWERFKSGGGLAPANPVGVVSLHGKTLVPCRDKETTPAMKDLLLEACDRFGVDPTNEARPRELASWNFYPGDDLADIPPSVVIVTHGGQKLRHFADPDYLAPGCTERAMDQDTEETLARIFAAFAKAEDKSIRRVPLPADLALPLPMVTGISERHGHVYRRGYLREGGAAEAKRRQADARRSGRK